MREATALEHNHIGTEHVLLGLLRDGDGLGARVLTEQGAILRGLRSDVLARLKN